MQRTKERRFRNRLYAWILTIAMLATTVLNGWTPVIAATGSETVNVTLTVIGDSGDHSGDSESHTGYVYWLKDEPVEVTLTEGDFIAANCKELIPQILSDNQIDAALTSDTLYPSSMSKDGVTLEGSYPGMWSVIVAYNDGTFSSDGWGNGNGAARLKEGCRLIYYWSDDISADCRLTQDDNYNTQLNYDTDAVTGVSLYTDNDPDSPVSKISCEVGSTVDLNTKLAVPQASKVSRELTWTSSNEKVATVKSSVNGAVITALQGGEADIEASLVNTLGDKITASCHVSVTADGTEYTALAFKEGNSLSLKPEDSVQLTPVFTPEVPAGENPPKVTWSSSDIQVASVDGGLIEAVKPGTATVSAAFTNNKGIEVKAECQITVESIPLTKITLDKSNLSMTKGDVSSLTVKLEPANATEVPDIEWSVDSSKVVSVQGNGKTAVVTAIGGGKAVVTAKAGTMEAKCSVTVQGEALPDNDMILKSLSFSKDSKAEVPYTVLKELDPLTGEMTVLVPENTNIVYVLPQLKENSEAVISVSYLNWNKTSTLTAELKNGERKGFSGTSRMLQSDQEARDVTFTIAAGEKTETYTIHFLRQSLVNKLTVTDSQGSELKLAPAFNNGVFEYEVTVPENIESIDLAFAAYNTNSSELKVNGQNADGDTYTLLLSGNTTQAVLTAGNDSVVPAEYMITVKRVAPSKLKINTTPEDAVAAVYDSMGRIWPEGDTYYLLPGETYSYSVTKTGYIANSGEIVLEGDKTLEIILEKASEVQLPDYEADWLGFRKDENNQAVVNADTATTPESAYEKWAYKLGDGYSTGAVSSPILVNNNLYCSSGKAILKVDKESGKVLKSGNMVKSSSFGINPPCYGNGMIFVGLAGGTVQAFNADTLESLWVYTDPLGGQPNCTIRYSDGYVYTGFWNSETKKANFVCLSATDEDPNQAAEVKTATWRYGVMGGFYWAGCYTNGDKVIVGSDDGNGGSNSETAYLYCLNKYTGELVQKVGPHYGDIRSDVSYYEGRIYFTTKGGWLYSYVINADGTVDESSRKELKVGNMSTSTPVISDNRLYVGFTPAGNFGDAKYGISVINIDNSGDMTLVYSVPTDAYPQTSGIIANGRGDGFNYVYFTTNGAEGNLYMVKDSKDMTEADPASGKLFTPSHKQYCISSLIADKEGTMYYKNDSGYMMAVAKRADMLKDIIVSGGNAQADDGESFNPSKKEHTVLVDFGTKSVQFTVNAASDAEVLIDGECVREKTISLNEGETKVTVNISRGTEEPLEYHYTITSRAPAASDATLKDLMVNTYNGREETDVKLNPAFDPEVTEYVAAGPDEWVGMFNIWPVLNDSRANLKVTAVSGVRDKQEGDVIPVTSTWKEYDRYAIYFADKSYQEPAKVKLTVTAENGTEKVYLVTLKVDKTNPVIIESSVTERTEGSARLSFSSSEDATLYYLVQGADGEAPSASDLKANGTAVPVKAGVNDIELSGLTKDAARIYMAAEDMAGNFSTVSAADIEACAALPGDLNGDGTLTFADVNLLLHALTFGEEIGVTEGDLNGDGKVTFADVNLLLERLTYENQ